MTTIKPEDIRASEITFGVELETIIPITAQIDIGGYHNGKPVWQARISNPANVLVAGLPLPESEWLTAPVFGDTATMPVSRTHWTSQRDSSIQLNENAGFVGCEFVSPILIGEAGIQNLIAMVAWLNAIGAKVTKSCGMHVHVGVCSVIKTTDTAATLAFCKKLSAVCQRLGLALYAQTGTNRHQSTYCVPVSNTIRQDLRRARDLDAFTLVNRYSLLNLRNVATKGTVEFRAFAGTLNLAKILHHLATCLAMCRYAHISRRTQWGANKKNWWKRAGNGENALRLFWAVMGWQCASSTSTHAFGLFGSLYTRFSSYYGEALRLARKFDVKYPGTWADAPTNVW